MDSVIGNKIVKFVDEYWAKNYRPPSYRDIQQGCDVSSVSVVSYWVYQFSLSGRWEADLINGTTRSIVPNWVIEAISTYRKQNAATSET